MSSVREVPIFLNRPASALWYHFKATLWFLVLPQAILSFEYSLYLPHALIDCNGYFVMKKRLSGTGIGTIDNLTYVFWSQQFPSDDFFVLSPSALTPNKF